VAFGWAVSHSQIQFTLLIAENQGAPPIWFLWILLIATLASSLLEEVEQALKAWLISTLFSIAFVLILMTGPVTLSKLDPQLASLIIDGTIQPLATGLMLTAPLNLFGCILGRVLRAR
jgi:hypothetical protein